ncbi:hypothetical protein BK666_25810 [Pseudomonas frederiksbergensis]|uniref:Uncharacterized protein n=1 Tax=Pseudomonas frederiksbergensis TaxID=104087 RepID=A0A423JSW4_9PSED|nr:hypothetical protein BK666_25810 [Pseudomonas frederiksbergensis]
MAILRRKIFGCQQIDCYAEQPLKLNLKSAEIKKCGAGQCIDQQIKVTSLFIRSEQRRTEDTRVGRTESTDDLAHGRTL